MWIALTSNAHYHNYGAKHLIFEFQDSLAQLLGGDEVAQIIGKDPRSA